MKRWEKPRVIVVNYEELCAYLVNGNRSGHCPMFVDYCPLNNR